MRKGHGCGWLAVSVTTSLTTLRILSFLALIPAAAIVPGAINGVSDGIRGSVITARVAIGFICRLIPTLSVGGEAGASICRGRRSPSCICSQMRAGFFTA